MNKHFKLGDKDALHDLPPTITGVAVVCRSFQVVPPHVMTKIDAFANCVPSLESASERGFTELLERLGKLEWTDVSESFRRKRLSHAVKAFFTHKTPVSVNVLKWWVLSYFPACFGYEMLEIFRHAVKNERLDVILWLHSLHKLSSFSLNNIQCYCPEIVYFLHEHVEGFQIKPQVEKASSESDFAYLKWVLRNQDLYEVGCLAGAAKDLIHNGELDKLKWLHTHHPRAISTNALAEAISSNQLDVAKWLETTANTFHGSRECECSTVPMIKWALQLSNPFWGYNGEKTPFVNQSLHRAVSENKTEAVKILWETLSPGRQQTYRREELCVMAERGNLTMVKWLQAHGAQRSETAMERTAERGHLDVIQWMFRCKYPYHEHVMDSAAANNHLDVVKWLHQRRRWIKQQQMGIWRWFSGYMSIVQKAALPTLWTTLQPMATCSRVAA